MDTWSLPKVRPISCNDCPAFQRLHMSFRCCSESFTRRLNVINTTFREKIYIRWCCSDRLSRQVLSECGTPPREVPRPTHRQIAYPLLKNRLIALFNFSESDTHSICVSRDYTSG